MFLSGDKIPTPLPQRLRSAIGGGVQVIGLGGPTEDTIWCTCYPDTVQLPPLPLVPYGKPIRNMRMRVLDPSLAECPIGVAGEIYVGGVGVSPGYWRNSDATQRQFVRRDSEWLHRSGDRGRYMTDGNIEILGRLDSQVKVAGHRIELGEVESALRAVPGVQTAVVTVVEQKDGQQPQLIACVVPQSAHTAAAAAAPAGASMTAAAVAKLQVQLSRPGVRHDLAARPATTVLARSADAASDPLLVQRKSARGFAQGSLPGSQLLVDALMPALRGASAAAAALYVVVKPNAVAGLAAGTYRLYANGAPANGRWYTEGAARAHNQPCSIPRWYPCCLCINAQRRRQPAASVAGEWSCSCVSCLR